MLYYRCFAVKLVTYYVALLYYTTLGCAVFVVVYSAVFICEGLLCCYCTVLDCGVICCDIIVLCWVKRWFVTILSCCVGLCDNFL